MDPPAFANQTTAATLKATSTASAAAIRVDRTIRVIDVRGPPDRSVHGTARRRTTFEAGACTPRDHQPDSAKVFRGAFLRLAPFRLPEGRWCWPFDTSNGAAIPFG